jgi:hypothetical protein
MMRCGLRFRLATAVLVSSAIASPLFATVDLHKKAKDAGYPVENCLYCHGEKLPKKNASTYNDRGKWLIAEKEKRGAKTVDVSWLKDYQEKK